MFDDIFKEFIYIREDSSLRSLKENIKYQLEEFELGGIDVWELIKKIETEYAPIL